MRREREEILHQIRNKSKQQTRQNKGVFVYDEGGRDLWFESNRLQVIRRHLLQVFKSSDTMLLEVRQTLTKSTREVSVGATGGLRLRNM